MKFKRFILLVVLVVSVMISGCVGGGGSGVSIGTELSAVWGKIAGHMKEGDPVSIVNYYTFPVAMIYESGDTVTVTSQDTLIAMYALGFAVIDETHNVTAIVTNPSQSGTTAKAVVTVTIDATVGGERKTATTVSEVTFKKVDGQWKISQEKTLSTS